MGECRFESPYDGYGGVFCTVHDGEVTPVLCTHAAADLERRVEELQAEKNTPVVYRKIGGVIYAVWGTSSINYVNALESRLARLEEEKAQAVKRAQVLADDKCRHFYDRAVQAEARESAMRERLGEAIAVIEKRTEHELDYGGTRGCRVGLTDLEKDCRCWRNPTLKRLRAAIAPDAGRALADEVK